MVQITRLAKDMAPDDAKTPEQRDDYYLRFANYEQGRAEHSDLNIALAVTDYKHRKILTFYSDKTFDQISHKGYDQVMDVLDIPKGLSEQDVTSMIRSALEGLDAKGSDTTTIIREEVDVQALKEELFAEIQRRVTTTGTYVPPSIGQDASDFSLDNWPELSGVEVSNTKARLNLQSSGGVNLHITSFVPAGVFSVDEAKMRTVRPSATLCVEDGLRVDEDDIEIFVRKKP